MHFSKVVIVAASVVGAHSFGADVLNSSSYEPQNVIQRDVAIIGGGSSGIYSAVRLKDHGKSVVVIEREAQLGGHAQTYTDSLTGKTFNIGVVVFSNTSVVTNYFKRLGVELSDIDESGPPTTYVDFATGQVLENYQPPNQTRQAAAFARYAAQIAKYPSLQGSFNMTYPVAPDILLPFGTFIQKYNLGDMMAPVFASNQGYAPLLNITTLYMIKYLNAGQLQSFKTGYLTTPQDNTLLLYEAAYKDLGIPNVLLKSNVLQMKRSSNQVKVAVSTPTGNKLIIARRLISTAPPLISNLNNYDLVDAETTLFDRFSANGYWTGVLNNTNLVSQKAYTNAVTNQLYHIPSQPGIYGISAEPNTTLTHVYFGSPNILSDAQVKTEISNDLNKLRKTLGYQAQTAQWSDFKSHAPFNLHVSTEDIQNRFYEKLYALNGQRSTFWNGAAFQAQDSSVIWQYTEDYIVPIVLGSLNQSS